VLAQAKTLIMETLSHDMGQLETPFVQTKVKETLSQFFFKATKRRPMIIPVAMGL
jgi:mRNA degradation ribonuclease J1/J2